MLLNGRKTCARSLGPSFDAQPAQVANEVNRTSCRSFAIRISFCHTPQSVDRSIHETRIIPQQLQKHCTHITSKSNQRFMAACTRSVIRCLCQHTHPRYTVYCFQETVLKIGPEMMYAVQRVTPLEMSEADYLAYADEQREKHEYSQGYVYAMTGGSLRHNVISGNTITHLNILLDDRNCLVSSSDTRIHIASKKAYRYPDVSVICDDPAYVQERTDTVSNPVLLVEVLSPSTAFIDYNDKLTEYTAIDSLAAYLLVAQDAVRVHSYIRHKTDEWLYRPVTGLDEKISIPTLNITLELARIYHKIDFSQ